MLLYALFFVLWIDIKMLTIYNCLLDHEEAELDQLVEGVDVCLDHPVEVLIDLNLGAYFLLNKMLVLVFLEHGLKGFFWVVFVSILLMVVCSYPE
jgi:hypothetical protein